MFSLHDSGLVTFTYFQLMIIDTKQARKQFQTLIVTYRKSLKEMMCPNLKQQSKISLPSHSSAEDMPTAF